MTMNGTLKGELIDLITCTEKMATDTYVKWLNDTKVNQFLESRFMHQTIDTVKEYILNNIESDNMLLLAMLAKDSGRHIGNVHLTINKLHKRCFIAYVIGETSYWGKGIATEAVKLATKYSFEYFDIDRMDGALYSNNIGSGKVVEKAGWKREGLRPQYCLLDNGERVDCIEVGLLREDFEKMDIYKNM